MIQALAAWKDIQSGVRVGPCRHANAAGGLGGAGKNIDGEEDINCHTRKWTDIHHGVFLDTLLRTITYPLLNPRYYLKMMNFLLPPGEICDGSQECICLSVAQRYRPRKDDQTISNSHFSHFAMCPL